MIARKSHIKQPLSLTRRRVLGLSGTAGAAALIGGGLNTRVFAQQGQETIPSSGAQIPTDDVTLRWLTIGGDTITDFWNRVIDAYQNTYPNISIELDPLPWEEIGQIVPLSVQNGNAHDCFPLPLSVPPAQAVREGWVAPLDDVIPNFSEWKAALPEGTFVEGISTFDGKTYTLPLSSNKSYGTLLLYNQEYMEQAGYDPVSTPLTWEEFRTAALKITQQGNGEYFGLIIEGNQVNRWESWVRGLAQMAGASSGDGGTGVNDIDWRTGEFVYTSDEYIAAIELLLAINSDGSVFPGSLGLNASEARAMMPQRAAGMILQGPWNIRQWQQQDSSFEFGVASQPVPNSREVTPLGYAPGGENQWWLYADSPNPAIVGDIFHFLGTLEGQTMWAEAVGVAEPSTIPEALASADISDVESRVAEHFAEVLRLQPSPLVRNPNQAQTLLEMQAITPRFGDVIQGLFTGQLSDPAAQMQDLQARSEAELERAIEAAREGGADVSRDDWVFPNWDPSLDYTSDDYADLDS